MRYESIWSVYIIIYHIYTSHPQSVVPIGPKIALLEPQAYHIQLGRWSSLQLSAQPQLLYSECPHQPAIRIIWHDFWYIVILLNDIWLSISHTVLVIIWHLSSICSVILSGIPSKQRKNTTLSLAFYLAFYLILSCTYLIYLALYLTSHLTY